MKRAGAVVFLILSMLGPARAEDTAREQADLLLLKATELEKFKPDEAVKYRREARFALVRPGMSDIKGTYVILHDTSTRWREDTEFGAFSFRQLRVSAQVWTKKNNDFTPLPVEEFWRAVNNTGFRMTNADVVKRVHNRKIEDVETKCVDFEMVRGKETEDGQICANGDPGLVVYWRYGTREVFYSEYSEFAGALRPHHIRIVFAGTDSIVADVSYARIDDFGTDAFVPMVDAESRRYCSSSQPAILEHAPDPVRPRTSSAYKGVVIVDVKIGTDGRVEKAEVAQTVHPDLDQAAVDAVKEWVYQPAKCDGEPVVTFGKVNVKFH
ncbi:MAG TPA: energy transducer TonB [Xanthobacteraceae bacterium]|nr:energy transducer TonB [Xanthobacteraceae bacterium]